jgi:hypothetical protein
MREILPQKSTKGSNKILHRHPKSWSGVTPLAVFEREIAAEGFSAVVTGETCRAACGDEMFGRRGRTHLTRLCRAGR